ncbi:MAG TPA: hypothetical protein DGH68_03400, partial [Bacteroidetes bacterium]|nr:hypothetical protein [Bacteroidota bacterium]
MRKLSLNHKPEFILQVGLFLHDVRKDGHGKYPDGYRLTGRGEIIETDRCYFSQQPVRYFNELENTNNIALDCIVNARLLHSPDHLLEIWSYQLGVFVSAEV